MSEDRVPMKPAFGLVRSPLAPRATTPKQAEVEDPKPALSVEDALAAERAKEEAFEKKAAAPAAVSPSKSATAAKPKRAAKPANVSASTGGVKRTTLSLPQELVDRMSVRRKDMPKVSQVQFILNALAAAAPRLKELVEAENGGRLGNDLFPVATSVRSTVGVRTTISFDTAEENLVIVDKLVKTSGAESRSQLVRVALGEVLAQD